MTIKSTIIADSISPAGIRITTYELEYPRFIHAEFMTHRVFSRNAASSRAIPIKRQIELIKEDTAMPSHWGKNQPGMSADEECTEFVDIGMMQKASREEAWIHARDRAIETAEAFMEAGYHKQIINRLLEPFAHIKVVLTATEYDNWFWLRDHDDAQPEIHELAAAMKDVLESSKPDKLEPGEWHLPYYGYGFWTKSEPISLEDARIISASCCAQVSYRTMDDSLEKSKRIFDRLVKSEPVHASPFEHQATPMQWPYDGLGREPGVTHTGHDPDIIAQTTNWSGNFRGWIQYRQLIPNNVFTKPKPGQQLKLDL